ncbi:50S ribosomal protein L18e [Candidatus Micrarchaeota archaeon]|nr:50S ribosomal protein L18e [Candidatus Micrarchaeota archaeon]
MKTGSEIQSLRRLLIGLEQASRKNDAPIWRKAAFYLGKPTRQRIEVNLNRISRISKNGDFILVPGKVLGIGEIDKKIKLAAYKFSKSAIAKLAKAGVETFTIEKTILANPKGSKIILAI